MYPNNLRPSLACKLFHVEMFDAILMFGSMERLREKIGQHFRSRDVNWCDGFVFNLLLDPVVVLLKVLGTRLIQWVLLKCDGPLIVTEKLSGISLLIPKVG